MDIINELIVPARQGNETAFNEINQRYQKMLVSLVDKYFSDCKDQFEDLMQEATIALYDAVRTFDINQTKVTFGLYAKICIRNRLISFKRKMLAQKKAEAARAMHSQTSRASERRGFDNEQLKELFKVYSEDLAPLERAVFPLYLQGQSYRDIANRLSIDEKSVGTAIYRMKRKLRKRL